MVKILINGALGRMGAKVKEASTENSRTQPVCGVDIKEDLSDANFPVYDGFDKVKTLPDVVVDFSSPSSLDAILAFCVKNSIPAVLCSTGYTEEHIEKINAAAKKIAIFRSANMSLGVNVIIKLVKEAAEKLKGFDIEITEMHHNKKVDAPSGTAIMIADAVKSVCPEKYEIYGRHGKVGKRDENEIGIHALRGGNVVGDHTVIFAGENEEITLSHSAFDRKVFAEGAVKAAVYITKKQVGLFDMNDLINE